jgi:hypothetical protein
MVEEGTVRAVRGGGGDRRSSSDARGGGVPQDKYRVQVVVVVGSVKWWLGIGETRGVAGQGC